MTFRFAKTGKAVALGLTCLLLFAPPPAYSNSFKLCLISVLNKFSARKAASLLDEASSRLKSKLNREPNLSLRDAFDPRRPRYQHTVELLESGRKLGDMNFSVDGDLMTIGLMYIEPDFRGNGVGGALMEAALKNFPKTAQIKVDQLSEDNFESFERQINRRKTSVDAIKSTAAYKIRKKLGFSKIVPGSINSRTGGFSVTRSD